MSIPDYARANFNTLMARHRIRLSRAGRMRGRRDQGAAPRPLRIGWDGAEYAMTPFGHLAPGNPYKAYVPPQASPNAGEPAPAGE